MTKQILTVEMDSQDAQGWTEEWRGELIDYLNANDIDTCATVVALVSDSTVVNVSTVVNAITVSHLNDIDKDRLKRRIETVGRNASALRRFLARRKKGEIR